MDGGTNPQPGGRPKLAAFLVLLLHGGAALLLLLPSARPAATGAPPPLLVTDIPAPRPADEGQEAPPAVMLADIPATLHPPRIDIMVPTVAPIPAPAATAPGGPATGGSSSGGTAGNGLGAGAGTGQGRPATRARRIAGNISRRDFPRVAIKGTPASSVTIRLTVGADGKPTTCAIVRPSGTPVRDATTCRLAMERFRYEPARDSSGRAVEDVAGWRQDWWPDTD